MTSAASYSNLVQDLYVAYFGRPADYFGLQNFEAALAAANAPTDAAGLAAAYSSNAAVKSLVDSFGTSAESASLYGSGSTASFVNAVFENLFNRAAAVSGLSFWVNAIDSGQVSKGDAALAILAGAFANSSSQGVADQATINNKVSVASTFTTDLGASSNDIVAYHGADAAAAARLLLAGVNGTTDLSTVDVSGIITNIVNGNTTNTYTLTTGIDSFTGGPGNNVFNATLGGSAPTLQSFDSITGGTLANTLNLVDFGTGSTMALPAGATISGMTALNVKSLEAVSLDLTGWSNLTRASIQSSTGDDSITVGDNVALQVVDTAGNVSTTGGLTISATTDLNHLFDIEGGAATTSVTLTGGGSIGGSGGGDMNHIVDNSTHGNTITSVSIINPGSGETEIEANGLTSLTVAGSHGYSIIMVDSAAGTRTLDLTLNGDSDTVIGDTTATTVNVNAVTAATSESALVFGAATSVSFNDTVSLDLGLGGPTVIGSNIKTLTIAGAGDFTANLAALAPAAVVDATASSGVVTIALMAGQSFTGGTGQDVVEIGAGQTGTVTGGSASHNEIVLVGAPAATVTDIAAVKNFTTFGVAGSTSGSFDMSKLANSGANYTAFDVQGSGGNVTFTNAAGGSSLSLENGNSYIATLQTADGNGANDSVNVTLGTATEGNTSYAQVTVEDSGFVGTATVNLAMNAAHSNDLVYLGSLFDQSLVTLNLSGNANSEIGVIATDSASLTVINKTTSTGDYSVTLDSITDNHLATLTFGGANGLVVNDLNSSSTTLTIVDNSSAGLWIDSMNDTALTSATFTNNVNGTAATFDLGSISEAGLATLNLNGNVAVTVTGDVVTSGITIAGGTDNAHVTISFAEATASGATDSITLGNGAGDSVTLGTGDAASTQTVVLGNGAGDSIVTTSAGAVNATVGSATTGIDTISANSASSLHATAGNGTNVISDTAAGATIAITAGTGANTIAVGDNASGSVTVGTHAATVVDSITVGVSGTSLTAIEKISGLANANVDTLTFSGDDNALTFAQVTAGSVVATGGNTTLLADWVAAADGLDGVVAGAAHNVTWFQFQGNTYLLESVAGQTADGGTMVAGNTLVELVGTGYTFGHATATSTAGGVVHLIG